MTKKRQSASESGEVASWLIVAAGLALAAVAAAGGLQAIVGGLVTEVGVAAGVPVTVDLPAAPSGSPGSPGGTGGPGSPGGTGGPGSPGGTGGPVVVTSGPGGTGGPAVPPGPAVPDPGEPDPNAPPSDTVEDVLEDIVSEIDNDDDLGISEGELDRIAADLAGLSEEELNWVFANLTDEQLVRLFHNVHDSGFWSNDWNDSERAAFYETLSKLDPALKARIYGNEAVLGELRDSLPTDGYLDMLVALDTDHSNGRLPNGAAVDEIINNSLPEEYLNGEDRDGVQSEGRLAILQEEDFVIACRHAGFAADRCSGPNAINGFVYEGRQFVSVDNGNAGTPIHEGLHVYNNGQDIHGAASGLSEGLTEYFTRDILAGMPDSSTLLAERDGIYNDIHDIATELSNVVSEAVVADAFFNDDLDVLKDAYLNETNRDEDDWDALLDILDESYPSDAEVDDAFDLLVPLPE